MEKIYVGLVLYVVFVIFMIIIYGQAISTATHKFNNEISENYPECVDYLDKFDLRKDCSRCSDSCKKINHSLFQFDFSPGGLFGSSIKNCYCVKGEEVKQVW